MLIVTIVNGTHVQTDMNMTCKKQCNECQVENTITNCTTYRPNKTILL